MADKKSVAPKKGDAKGASSAKKAASKPAASKKQVKKTRTPVELPTLDDLLNAGAHFGHRKSRWHPSMEEYIYTERNGVHIIDLVKTMKLLKQAVEAIQDSADAGSVLIVGTKGQAATMVQKVAEDTGAFYVNTRWPGGLFTNYKQIKKSIDKLIKMEEQLASGAQGLVKKEQLMLAREISRLNRLYEGIKFMDRLPKIVIVIDSRVEKNVITEANNVNIPIVALIDTNCDPDLVTYPVPANDDSIRSIQLFVDVFGKAIATGKRSGSVIALRNTHKAKIEQTRREYEHGIETKQKMAEEELERLKKMRAGEEIEESPSAGVVRVVKKADVEVDEAEEVAPKAKAKAKKAPAKSKAKPKAKKVARKAAPKKEAKSVSVEDLDLGTRAEKALTEAGYKTTADLKGMDEKALTDVKGIGAKAAEEILKAIK